ncbi:MAG: hypothetical protein KF686_03350 [Ramlibacter sp.]|nr:hypothetical protein [Ramlibacter sp.]
MTEIERHQLALAAETGAADAALAALVGHEITDAASAGVHDSLTREWVLRATNANTIAERIASLT